MLLLAFATACSTGGAGGSGSSGAGGTGVGGKAGGAGAAGTSGTAGLAAGAGGAGAMASAGASGSAGDGASAGTSGASGSAGGGLGGTSGGGAGTGGGASGGGAGASGSGGAGSAGTSGDGGASAAGAAGSGEAGNAGNGGAVFGPCSASGLTFCSDFEDQTTDMPPSGMGLGTHLNGNGTVTVDATTPAHSGMKSVHVYATGYQTFFKLTGAPVFPAPSGKLYVRVYVRLSEPMTGGHNTYFEAGLDASSDAPFETRVGVMNGMLMINQPDGDRGFLSNQNFYNDQLPGVVIAPATWACVESYFDTPASTVDFWVDGVEVPDLHRTDWQQETYDALRFGYEKYAGPDTELWYDDLAVGTAKIGCFP